MMIQKYVTQPFNGIDYLTLFRAAQGVAEFDRFDAAVAYATMGGVVALESVFNSYPDRWATTRKRFLVGIDWCRSDPIALDALAKLPASSVKIPNGAAVVQRRACMPMLPFHPKAFILRGRDALAIISGSGNLSRNGFTRGHECGSVLAMKAPLTKAEERAWTAAAEVATWFEASWAEATPLRTVRARYAQQHDSLENLQNPPPTDDDAAESSRTMTTTKGRRALLAQRLRQLRAARHLWIEAGNLHKNRGPENPGNQLMMSPMTRVFFGFAACDVARDTFIGHVRVRYRSHRRDDCSLRFSNNSMDVLTLPVPDAGGPAKYDRETLLFEKQSDQTFLLSLGTTDSIRRWKRRSSRLGSLTTMSSGRQWGVF